MRPTCSEKHLPGYIEKAEELKAAGAEVVACVSVNDAFVMKAWGEQQKATGKVRMLADAKCQLTKALDMELDASAKLGNIRRELALDGITYTCHEGYIFIHPCMIRNIILCKEQGL